jgi:aspartate ammonia-lyase
MNGNEVIANVALKGSGRKPGAYEALHPIDAVNMSQSTNDVYPTAARLAVIILNMELVEELKRLAAAHRSTCTALLQVQGHVGAT